MYKDIYKASLPKDVTSILGLSDYDLESLVGTGIIPKDTLDLAVALDNMFYDQGLSSSLSIGKTARTNLGYDTPTKSSKGANSTKKSKSSITYKNFIGGDPTATTKSLRSIVEQAVVKRPKRA